MSKNNGGPAFPCRGTHVVMEGMTLRDYFAAKAIESGDCPYISFEHARCAQWAFERADAMLAERDK